MKVCLSYIQVFECCEKTNYWGIQKLLWENTVKILACSWY